MARQDRSWNGTIQDCEFYVSNDPEKFDTLAVKVTFRKTKEPQKVTCEPVRGRYVLVRALSEVNGRPWASIAELGVIGRE
ncbi:MAG: discoidin domain-containing protein [Planctomycetes bacterium]|nr:discoidin domain-containing protein [Planctomycetota bacterium]